jgi:hypothetical protein
MRRDDANLEPSHVKQKLEEGEKRKIHVSTVTVFEKLPTHQTRQEETVHGQRHDLQRTRIYN